MQKSIVSLKSKKCFICIENSNNEGGVGQGEMDSY